MMKNLMGQPGTKVSPEELKEKLGDRSLCRSMDGKDRKPGPWRFATWSYGTRGDFQPFLILADTLKSRGHQVMLCSDRGSKKTAEEWGHDFIEVYENSVEELMASEGATKASESGDLMAIMVAMAKAQMKDEMDEDKTEEELVQKGLDAQKEVHRRLDEFQPDCVLYNVLANAACDYCRPRGIPIIEVSLQPQNLPSESMKPISMYRVDMQPGQPHMYLWFLQVTNALRGGMATEQQFAQAGLENELEQAVMSGAWTLAEEGFDKGFLSQKADVPIFEAYSGALFPPPADWPEGGWEVFGNFKIPGTKQKELAEKGGSFYGGSLFQKCADFIAAGSPPVYIGWGSMIVKSGGFMCRLAVGALKEAGQRAIIVSGWAKLDVDLLDGTEEGDDELKAFCADNVLFVKAAPHEWLFPQCICAVHHGGIGTTQASISAGLPTIVTPVLADQWDISENLTRRKVGCGTGVTLAKVTSTILAEKIKLCCTDKEIRESVNKVSAEMKQEDGVGKACAFLENFVEKDFSTGKWKERLLQWRKDQWTRFLKRKKRNPDQVCAAFNQALWQKFPQLKQYQSVVTGRMTMYHDLMQKKNLFVVKAASGLLTREGEGLKTKEVGRIAESSILERVEEKGSRMKVKMHEGFGPTEGWISTQVAGKDVLTQLATIQDIGTASTAVFMKQFADMVSFSAPGK